MHNHFSSWLKARTEFALADELRPRKASEFPDPEGVRAFLIDTIARYPTLWSWDSGITAKTANLYAAMPSLHAAYAVWAALVAVAICAPRWARWLAWFYVVATFAAIMGTGNHFLLDAVAGLVTALLAYAVACARDGIRLLHVAALMSIPPAHVPRGVGPRRRRRAPATRRPPVTAPARG